MDNNISFQARINFVSCIDKYANQKHLNMGELVKFDLTGPLYVKGENFHTDGIKTCTGGGFTDGTSKALGFHWLDDIENYLHIQQMCNCIFNAFQNKNISGIIIGGKSIKGRDYSIETINHVVDYFIKKVKNLSVFQEHLDTYGSTSYIYNLKDNSWTLSTGYIDKNGKYCPAQTLEDLKKCYRRIFISDGDTLCFNGAEVPKESIKAAL